jgi:hypothetical protein
MGYQTVHYYKYGNTDNCVESYQYVPDGDALKSQITNAYKSLFGRYGEPGGLEGHYSVWSSGEGKKLYGSVFNMVKEGGVSSGELETINNNGKHTGLSTGSCPVKGCTDSQANNYDPGANQDDGSCTYDPPTVSISLSQSWIVNTGTQSSTLSWSTGGGPINSISAPSKGPKSPTSTTTYSITATGPGGTASASTTLTVYQPPTITLTLGSSSIISGGSTTLSWDVTGDTTTTTIDQGIGNVVNNGTINNINPTVTTTYSATTTFEDPNGNTYSDSDSITLIVYQPPTLDITLPTDVNYGEDITLEYGYEYANISAKVTPQYRYRNANNDGLVNVTGDTVDLTPLSSSAEFGVPGTLVADKSVVLSPVYNDDGPFEINYTVEVKGDGGTETITQNVKINIDLTPDNIAIPDTVGEKDEEPVYTPDPDEYPDTELEIKDVDIPVEIKSNAPIKVSKDGGNTWLNVREKT